MTRELVFDMESVDRLSREMVQVTRNISTIIDQLEVRATDLLGQWSGEAAEAYEAAQRNWTQEIAMMKLVLEKLAVVVADTGAKQAHREAANARVWGS